MTRQLVQWGLAAGLALLVGCNRPDLAPAVAPSTGVAPGVGAAAPRLSGNVGSPERVDRSAVSYAPGRTTDAPSRPPVIATTGGDVSLDFADTDIREVTAQVLGGLLHVNYTIDPAVHGNATLHTSVPVPRSQLLAILQVLLSQAGASLVNTGPLYRVVPAASAQTTPGLAGAPTDAGEQVVTLRYAAADQLARVLQPFAGTTARLAAEPGSNAVVIAGEPGAREALANLVRAFDVDSLANQSMALMPVGQGNAREFAAALQQAMDTQGGAAGAGGAAAAPGGVRAGLVHIVAMERINAVLVTAPDPRTIDQARRIFTLVQRRREATVRSWHVYFLQNGRSNDVAYVMQQAFTPDHVTAQPTTQAQLRQVGTSAGASGISGIGQGGVGGGGVGGIGGGSLGGLGSTGGGLGSGSIGTATAPSSGASTNPLLGGLDPGTGGGGGGNADTMRIVPNNGNNALLIYGTPQELDTVEAMLRKIDILPLQVRIDAVIAEVELNDALQYGTQFFFKSGGLNGTLTQVFSATNSFAGYFLAGSNASQVALSLLQAVSTVHVLSSPELMVLDNQPARLEVGDLVPYLTQQAQSTVTSTASVINSVQYEQTGVILEVTPRVNSDGLVTLDIAQEVSNVDTSATQLNTNGISSPTFLQRDVQSRVVVQDGQTIGLAGLIQDSVTRSNQGVPYLKDIPVVGALFGQQNNTRTRTELMVLITPHVIHDQRDALALTQDAREHLPGAANVPTLLRGLRPSGSDDPNLRLRGEQQ